VQLAFGSSKLLAALLLVLCLLFLSLFHTTILLRLLLIGGLLPGSDASSNLSTTGFYLLQQLRLLGSGIGIHLLKLDPAGSLGRVQLSLAHCGSFRNGGLSFSQIGALLLGIRSGTARSSRVLGDLLGLSSLSFGLPLSRFGRCSGLRLCEALEL